ncbi:hypothetical protein FQN52_006641 [Onygenales sp. PD_12]|nr:hypothetical protein FQN52_006641 [Onygenales sp. PD_12]
MAYDAANLEFSETPRIELPVQLDGAQSKVRLLAIIILILEVHFNVQQGYAIEVRVEPESESPERRNQSRHTITSMGLGNVFSARANGDAVKTRSI